MLELNLTEKMVDDVLCKNGIELTKEIQKNVTSWISKDRKILVTMTNTNDSIDFTFNGGFLMLFPEYITKDLPKTMKYF